jgi:hypothetical protein
MKHDVLQLPDSHRQVLDETPELLKVRVILLDRDNLPLAKGSAVMPLSLGVGVFWPECSMPSAGKLCTAKCFTLASGETLNLIALTLCDGDPPRYDFWVDHP